MADRDDRVLDRRLAIAATVVATFPVILFVITRAGHAYLPTQDFAVIDLRVRDVWSGDLPLTGAYSRFGWNHPGPLLFWLLAPLNALFGGAPWTTLIGHALLQLGAIVLTAWLAWRRGGLALVLGALAIVLLTYRSIGDYVLFQPWNPHVALLFFPALVLAIWGLALGDAVDLVVAVLVGTFLVQTHVGYVPLVLAAGAVAAGFVLVDVRHGRLGSREDIRRRWRTPILVSVVASVLLWIPVLYDQAFGDGNLRKMAAYFLHDDAPKAGVRRGLGFLATEYRILPPWLGGKDPVTEFTIAARPSSVAWLLIPGLLITVAAWASWRRRDVAGFRFVTLVAVFNVAGIVSLSRVTGAPWRYLFYWRIPLAPLTILACGWALARGFEWARRPAVRTFALVGLAMLLVVPAARYTQAVADHPGSVSALEPMMQAMLPKLERAADDQTVLLRVADDALLGVHGGLFDALDRAGYRVRVDPDGGFQFGESRVVEPERADWIWFITEQSGLTSTLSAFPTAHVLAKSTPLPPAQERELTRLHRELADQLRAAGREDLVPTLGYPLVEYTVGDVDGVDPAIVKRVAHLNEKVQRTGRCRCAVIAFRPDEVPAFTPGAPQ